MRQAASVWLVPAKTDAQREKRKRVGNECWKVLEQKERGTDTGKVRGGEGTQYPWPW